MKLVTSLATIQNQFLTTYLVSSPQSSSRAWAEEKCNGGRHGGGRGRGREKIIREEGEIWGNHATTLNQKSVGGGGSGESGTKVGSESNVGSCY